ncbi:methyltransferase domain-containing protein [Bradyrhizobium sp. 24]|uniref:class I SAM-dependent methyltransferase n=1 Tax=unclassified Bradyrhizobium TaxID=2631580 RepID=UPI001FFB5E33|nr:MULTISPECIES: class I SAM-dependent methyltransferase [unclassified Bradyrhizobium]MCK1303757.1 methyltransferase domain-containing protein [Bradyrhizobium sp. 37]MCK1380878.1 methyltransferase domain-containing protein [Bradyrhizobium sp. 24]MCK1772352.1 methyltransferase domain-containing protein [Bradyrhizobium sp. 134]
MRDPVQFWNDNAEFANVARDPNSFFARRTALVAELVSHLISPGRMLDIGCGAGQLCFDLARRGFDVHGADLSSVQIEMAIESARGFLDVPEQRFKVCTPHSLPFSGRFDLITAIGVLPYVEDHSAFVQRSRSLMEPSGMFVASCTNRRSLFTVVAMARHVRSFRPDRAWLSVLANLVRTGLWSGTCVDFRTTRQCGSAAALDRMCDQFGLTNVGELDLYNLDRGLFDGSPFKRGRFGRILSRHLGWTHVGAYRLLNGSDA